MTESFRPPLGVPSALGALGAHDGSQICWPQAFPLSDSQQPGHVRGEASLLAAGCGGRRPTRQPGCTPPRLARAYASPMGPPRRPFAVRLPPQPAALGLRPGATVSDFLDDSISAVQPLAGRSAWAVRAWAYLDAPVTRWHERGQKPAACRVFGGRNVAFLERARPCWRLVGSRIHPHLRARVGLRGSQAKAVNRCWWAGRLRPPCRGDGPWASGFGACDWRRSVQRPRQRGRRGS